MFKSVSTTFSCYNNPFILYCQTGITQGKYDQMKEEFLTEGVADRDLLKCMFSQLLPLETNGPFMEVINLLMDNLDLGYMVAKQ